MAKLNAAERKALPKSDFAGPGRSYPVEDASHARNALSRASELYKRGDLSDAAYSKIKAKAHAKLGEKGKSDPPKKDPKSDGARNYREYGDDRWNDDRGGEGSSIQSGGQGKPGISDSGVNKINSRLQGNSESRSDPNGNKGETGMRGSTASYKNAPYRANPENSDGDYSGGADGASRDRTRRA